MAVLACNLTQLARFNRDLVSPICKSSDRLVRTGRSGGAVKYSSLVLPYSLLDTVSLLSASPR